MGGSSRAPQSSSEEAFCLLKWPTSQVAVLHIAYANVGRRRGIAGFIEVLLDNFFERALSGENEVDRVASGSEASGVRSDVVSHGFDFLAGVGRGDCEPALPHDRQVNDIVADITKLIERCAGF